MKKSKWKRICINLCEKDWRRLHKMAGDRCVNMSQLVREIVDAWASKSENESK